MMARKILSLGLMLCLGVLSPSWGAAQTPPAQPPAVAKDWFGQLPPGAAPSPATRSLAGDWQAEPLIPGPTVASGEDAPPPDPLAPPGGAAPIEQAQAPIAPAPPPPPPPPVAVDPPTAEPDHFTALDGGYSLYQNGRYGTFISYPSGYFLPDPPPANGDGRRFASVDGSAAFHVFAQYNALGLTQAEMIAQDRSDPAHATVTYERAGPGWYVLSGFVGADIYYRRVIEDMTGLVQVFEITYPAARKADFDAVVAFMADSFGPGSDMTAPAPTEADLPAVDVTAIHTPARNSAEWTAIIDAARPGAVQEIGRDVIFVISQLRTDGTWAYLQGRPANPDGSPLDWASTPFAQEMRDGVMSDVYMALLLKTAGEWTLVQTALGPTDVAWYDWLEPYGLPEALFWGQ